MRANCEAFKSQHSTWLLRSFLIKLRFHVWAFYFTVAYWFELFATVYTLHREYTCGCVCPCVQLCALSIWSWSIWLDSELPFSSLSLQCSAVFFRFAISLSLFFCALSLFLWKTLLFHNTLVVFSLYINIFVCYHGSYHSFRCKWCPSRFTKVVRLLLLLHIFQSFWCFDATMENITW